MSQWKIRPAKESDVNFILNSWLRKFRDSVWYKIVTDKVYYQTQHQVIRKILGTAGLNILVACAPDDEDQIYGYIVGEKLADDWLMIHWSYVKGPFRRFGIFKDLAAGLSRESGFPQKVHYSHKTQCVKFLDPENKTTYNPYYIWSIL